jgi:hypothetical protein
LARPAEGRLPDGSNEQRAHEISREARKALRDGRKDIAVERLREAWEVFKNPWYLCDLGGVYMDMGRISEAAQSLSACLRLMKPKDQKFVRPKVERALKDARSKVGELTVDANVPDAEVFVDGKATGKLPLEDPIFLDPGSHEVEVKAPGYLSDVRMAVLKAGTTLLIRMRLDPMRVEVAPPAPERMPREPEKEAKLPNPAPLRVEPEASARGPAILPTRSATVQPVREPVRPAVILGGFGLGVAGVAVGVAGFMAAGAAREQAKEMAQPLAPSGKSCEGDTNNPCLDVYDTMGKAVALTTVGVAGMAVSAVGGAMIIYEFVRASPKEKPLSARIVVRAAPGEGALKIVGSF